MKKIFFGLTIFAILSAALAFAKLSSGPAAFKPAEDFPRDAMIYLQIRDLPAAIRLWNESELRSKFLESWNFADFKKNHLGLKLAARAAEIEAGLGIFPDLGFASTLGETGAALAVYDVGKLEFVFIAPMSEEKILASRLFEMRANFEELRLADDTTVFTKEIEIDRERQRQKIFFANFKGRLILATSEKYFLRTIANIGGKTPSNRLSAEPAFRAAAARTAPHLATVWLDLQKLGDDWYFEHYWLMGSPEKLKNLRAGMFDFEITDQKAIERRVFLTAAGNRPVPVPAAVAERLGELIPENVQFSKTETATEAALEKTLADVLFDDRPKPARDTAGAAKSVYYFRDWEQTGGYYYLDDDFSAEIDEAADDDEPVKNEPEPAGRSLAGIFRAAAPIASVRLFSPQIRPAPLFLDNRKALVVSLANPGRFDRHRLEDSIAGAAQKRYLADHQKSPFRWTDLGAAAPNGRQLTMPALGWGIFYARRGGELIFSNSPELLREIAAPKKPGPKAAESFDALTVIDLAAGRETFAETFGKLENVKDKPGDYGTGSFFTGNVGSLLDVAGDVARIEIKQTSAPNLIFEEIGFVFRAKPAAAP